MAASHLECSRCGATHEADRVQTRCSCGGALLARYHLDPIPLSEVRARPPGLWRYRELLPLDGVPEPREPVTPLIAAERISEELGVETFVKDEGVLPTGTFKARGAAIALGRAVELGVKRVVLPSAGNAGAAWSLYGARYGVETTVVMAETAPATNQAEVKLAGARLELVDGSIADAGLRAAEIAADEDALFAATFNEPYRIEGKKTAWLEVFDALGDERAMRFPRTIVVPVGGGVAAIALAKAAEEVSALGWCDDDPPRIVGVQPQDCPPIVRAFQAGADDVDPWPTMPTTIAAGLRVPAPVEGAWVLRTIRASDGTMVEVPEDDIVGSVKDLAAAEGVLACPEGAATFAAARRLAAAGELEGPVVLYNTGSAIKYLDALTAAP